MGSPDGVATNVLWRVRIGWPIDRLRLLPVSTCAMVQGAPRIGVTVQPAIGIGVPITRHGEPEILTLGLSAPGVNAK